MIQIAAGTYRFTSGTVIGRAAAALAAGHVGAVCDDVSIQFAQRDHAADAAPCCSGRPAARSRSSRASGWVRSPCSRRSRTVCSASPSAGRSPWSSSPRSCAGSRRNETRLAPVQHNESRRPRPRRRSKRSGCSDRCSPADPFATPAPRASRILNARLTREVDASSCEQSSVRQSLAGMVVGKKNRCILVTGPNGGIARF